MNEKLKRRSLVCAGIGSLVTLTTGAFAHEQKAGSLTILHPWARATAGAQKNGAVYALVRNDGSSPDRIVGARTPEASRAEIHSSTVTDGIARMVPLEGIDVPANGEALLMPGGVHIMLVGLKNKLYEATSFPMTLVFAKAGEVPIEVMVESVTYGSQKTDDGHQADH